MTSYYVPMYMYYVHCVLVSICVHRALCVVWFASHSRTVQSRNERTHTYVHGRTRDMSIFSKKGQKNCF